VEISTDPIISADGNLEGFVSVLRDVTERKRAEQAVRESEDYYRALIEQASEGVTIADLDGTIRYESPSVKRVLGYTPEELLGKKSLDLIHPEDQQKSTEPFVSLLDKPGATVTRVNRVRHKDGSWRFIESTVTNLIHDPKIHGLVSNYRDVTEHIQAEEELKAYQERLKDAMAKLRVSYEELSTPVVQIWDQVLAIPLIGILDTHRAKNVMEVLLTRIVETRAQVIVLDVTGVATMDTQVTNHLLQTASSCELLGAECVITGIKPEVAQAMIHIGVDLTRLNTKRDLQDGLRYALAKIGHDIGGTDSLNTFPAA
jgi:rsbT co-antagonist protein RsbR